jgi:hypothetical protein
MERLIRGHALQGADIVTCLKSVDDFTNCRIQAVILAVVLFQGPQKEEK